MTRPSETDLAWAAGFIDGEGTFYARSQKPSTRTNAHRQLFVTVGNTDKRPLEKLQNLFGGALRGPYRRDHPVHKPYWVWQMSSFVGVSTLIEWLMPFLLVKREQAQVALDRYAELDDVLAHRRVSVQIEAACQRVVCRRPFSYPDYQRGRKFCSHSCAARSRYEGAA